MDITWEEKASIVSVFLVKTTSSYLIGSALFKVWSSTTVATALCMDNGCMTLAFAHGIAKASISLSFMTFNYTSYSGGSQNNGDLFHKLKFIWDDQGYLVFIIALNSIHLNLENNIA